MAEGVHPGQLVIDATTGGVDDARRIGGWLAERGAAYLETPIAASSEQTRRGEAVSFVGGSPGDFERATPLLADLVAKAHYVGEWGAAASFKLVNNLILGLNRAALAEGLALAERLGLDLSQTLTVLRQSNSYSGVMDTKGDKMAARDYANDGNCPQDVAGRCFVNSNGINRSKGFEAEASGELLPGLQVAAGYTFNTTRAEDGEPISAQTPKHMLRLNTNYTLPGEWNRVSVGGGVSAQSHYDDAYNGVSNSGRALFDARAAYKLDQNWTVGVDVENLLDRKYFDSTGYWTRGTTYGAPRSYMLTLRGEF